MITSSLGRLINGSAFGFPHWFFSVFTSDRIRMMNTILINNISQPWSQGLSSYWDKIPWEQGWIFEQIKTDIYQTLNKCDLYIF